ncbi:Protein translocase subunit secA [Anopheles sinensis]|uniref:Protein translocase subunit secA n=1 Tax=Anopheles sinensis TaxID=74873 RepID=A0A084VIP5_ANOSI|nr:Protein translocase subunit secA [Anopheles sinensis]
MTSEYIGQEGILHYLQYRLSCEGIHVSCEEMYFVINFILSYCLAGVQVQYTFAWLIAAYPQRNWIDELILMHLENHFRKLLDEKPKWRGYLSKIHNKEVLVLLSAKLDHAKSITIDRMETVLYLLSNIQSGSFSLEALELTEWPYVLKEKYWLNKLNRLCDAVQGCEDSSTTCYYVLSVENIYTTEMVESLLTIFTSKVSEANFSPNKLTTVLSNFHTAKWNLSEADLQDLKNATLDEWIDGMDGKYTTYRGERTIRQLVALIRCNGNSSEQVKNNLPNIEKSINQINDATYEVENDTIHSLESELFAKHIEVVAKFTEEDINIWLEQRQRAIKGNVEIDSLEILAVINRAVELKRGFSLRDTQKLAVLALLANDRSTLAQVSTGEGKSLIVVAASIVIALGKQKST